MNMKTTEVTTEVVPEKEPEDLRSAIEAAVEEHEEPSESEAAEPALVEVPEVTEPALVEAVPVESEPAKPEVQQPAPAVELPDSDPVAKAPGTWTPVAREKWVTLPAEIKQEVWKREREASRALTISADARRLQQDFEKTIQPYLGFIAAEKSTPLQAVNNMMQTAAMYRVGTPQQKAEVTAQIIKQFNVDLRALDSILAGQPAQYDPAAIIDQRIQAAIAPLKQEREQFAQRQQAQLDQEVDQELNNFINDPKHEFYDDVRDTMADLIEVASRRGIQMGLTEAYERATLLHEPVRRVIEARKQAEAAKVSTQRARQARGAAVSVTQSAEVRSVPKDPGDSIRSAIEAAMSKTEGR
jgi:hypothetical protein